MGAFFTGDFRSRSSTFSCSSSHTRGKQCDEDEEEKEEEKRRSRLAFPPIFRTISRTIAINIKAISPGIPPFDTIIPDIITLRNQINALAPPQALLGIHTYLVSGSVEIVFTDSDTPELCWHAGGYGGLAPKWTT